MSKTYIQPETNFSNRLLERGSAKVGGSRPHSEIFCGKSSQNSPKPVVICWSSIPCVMYNYALLKVVGYYDLSVMGFPKSLDGLIGGWVCGVSSIQLFLEFL